MFIRNWRVASALVFCRLLTWFETSKNNHKLVWTRDMSKNVSWLGNELRHKANQISICGANWCKYSWTHHRVIDGLHYSWLVLGKTLTTYPWHIIHICLIFQWPNKKNRPKRRQENAKKCDKNFLISARKKPSRPQNQKFCILKNITRQEIEFGVEWCF